MDDDYIEEGESEYEQSQVEFHHGAAGSTTRDEEHTQEPLTESDIMQLQFDTHEEALEWYKRYAKCVGFGVRKDDRGFNSKCELIWHQFVCCREGKRATKHLSRDDRKREPKRITRVNCQAMIRVKLDKESKKWSVVKVQLDHNHKLTASKHVHLIPCHRSLNEADIAQVETMRSYGVKTAHIMGFISGQSSGPVGVGFCRKDLYNHLDKQRRSLVADGDAFAALSYLQAKANDDPMMFVKYTTDDDGRLENLFWCDGISQLDYEVFGDVIQFDITYRKNKYNKPLVIFFGVNHHDMTVVFACALLVDESFDIYKWVLESLLEAMGHKKPNAVVTDGDKAMRKAIKDVFPGSTHRLCAWYLQRNAKTNIKHQGFSADMAVCVYENMTIEQWEIEWEKLVAKYNVQGHKWVNKLYKRRAMWAVAWLRGKFFASIRTTSMCEGINSFIKHYVESTHSLIEFLHHFERALAHYRNNELNADFASTYGEQVLTSPLRGIEKSAAMVYTREVFKKFKVELNAVAGLIASISAIIQTTVTYDVSVYLQPGRQWTVHCDRVAKLLKCSCSSFESFGVPCSHVLCVLKHEHMDSLPPSLICKRWTKNCKSFDSASCGSTSNGGERLSRLRYAALVASAHRMCHLASQDAESFNEARESITTLSSKFEVQRQLQLLTSDGQKASVNATVEDPAKVRIKGAPKKGGKRNKCSKCGSTGHNIRRCPLLLGTISNNDVLPSSDSEDAENQIDSMALNEGGSSMEHYYRPVASDIMREPEPPLHSQQSANCGSSFSQWFH